MHINMYFRNDHTQTCTYTNRIKYSHTHGNELRDTLIPTQIIQVRTKYAFAHMDIKNVSIIRQVNKKMHKNMINKKSISMSRAAIIEFDGIISPIFFKQ